MGCRLSRAIGVEHTAFDPLKGDVDISGQSGAVKMEAFF